MKIMQVLKELFDHIELSFQYLFVLKVFFKSLTVLPKCRMTLTRYSWFSHDVTGIFKLTNSNKKIVLISTGLTSFTLRRMYKYLDSK